MSFPEDEYPSEETVGSSEEENEEDVYLAADSAWFGIANSTKHKFKVETYNERARQTDVGGSRTFLPLFLQYVLGKELGVDMSVPVVGATFGFHVSRHFEFVKQNF